MTVKTLLLPLTMAALTATSAAQGQSFRCRDNLVSVGDPVASVRKACGEPVVREKICEAAPPEGDLRISACADGENWTYRPGYGQFVTTLRFEDGTLMKISYGDRQ